MDKKTKIGFVGAGKAGFTLGKYFKERGACVTGYFSRNKESAKEAAFFTGTKQFAAIEQVLEANDVLFLTVPDAAIETIWSDIKKMQIRNKIICHCSGVLSSEVFDGINQMQAFGYSVHPLFAIHSKQNSYKEMAQVLFSIEGDEKYIFDLKTFIEQMGNHVSIIKTQQKVKYHAAAVFLSNHIAALAHVGCKLFQECGFEKEITDIALKTLFAGYCEAITLEGPVKTLTGPIERNDLSTVEKHLKYLDENERKLYALLSKQLIDIAKEKNAEMDYSAMELLICSEIN